MTCLPIGLQCFRYSMPGDWHHETLLLSVRKPCLSSGSTHNESRSYHAFLNLILRYRAFNKANKDVCGFFSDNHSTLFNRRKHRVTRNSPMPISESTDTNIIGNTQSHALGSIENADCSVVVDGEKKHQVGRALTTKQE